MKENPPETDLQASFTAAAQAARSGGARELRRHFHDLARTLTPKIERHLRLAGVALPDQPDLRQDVLVKVHEALRNGPPIANTEAWLRRVCKNAAIDRHRRTKGRTYLSWVDAPGEEESTTTDRALFAAGGREEHEAADRAVDARRVERTIVEAAGHYAERAECEGDAPRGHQVLAWYGVQVLEASTAEVLEAIAKRYGRTAKGETLWQWKRRGGALVRQLAARDEDRVRGALMARLVSEAA